MKFFSCVILFIFLIYGCKPKGTDLNPDLKSELSENVVQLSSNTDKVVALEGNIIVMKGLVSSSKVRLGENDIKVGSIIEAEPSKVLPDGLLVKVQNISSSPQYGPGYNNLEIIPAKLEDYVKNCPKSESKENFTAEFVETEPNVIYKINSQSVEFEIQKTFNHSANTVDEKGSLKVSGKIHFERDLKLGLAVEKSSIKYFKYEIINKDKIDLKVSGDYTLAKEKEYKLATIKGKRIKFLLGGIPVWVKPIFNIGLKISAKGGIKLEAEIIKFEKEYIRGAEFVNGNWKSIDTDKPTDETTLKRDIDLNGEAKVAINAGFEGSFYEGLVSLGLEGEVFTKVNSRISFNEPLKADFKAGIDFNVNIKSSVFSKSLANFTYTFASWEIRKEIIDLKKDILITTDIPVSGLIAYYPFNGNTYDESGYKNHGVSNQFVSLVSDRKSKANSACSFGGIDRTGFIKIPNASQLNINKTITISIWYKINSYYGMDGWGSPTQNGYQVLIGKEGDRNGYYVGISNNELEKKQSLNFNNNINFSSNFSIIGNSPGNNIENLNKWNHLVTISNGTIAKMYVNGALINSLSINPDFSSSNTKELFIGTMWALNESWYPFNGSLDDIRIYNRGLSDTEINALFRE